MKPSHCHSNNSLNNWLIYKIGDKFLEKYASFYKGHLVDLGCGEATYKQYFLQYAESYTGVDWSNTLHNTGADVVSDLNKKIELASESADTIISLSVLEHLCEPQVMLNEAFRILKPGGKIILQVPWQWWVHEAPHDYYRYTPYGLKYLFEKAGFREINVEPSSGFFTMWFLKFNYFTSRFIIGPKLLQYLIKTVLYPLWFFLQLTAPFLDILDRNWAAEAPGYWVVARL